MSKTEPFKYLEKAVQTKINQLARLVKKTYKKTPDVTVVYTLNSANSLGTCKTTLDGKSTLRLNPMLLNELKEDYINQVVVHEYAHATADLVYGRGVGNWMMKPHGREFKHICALFGISGRATTSIAKGSKAMAASGQRRGKQPRIAYVCGCDDKVHEITKTRHNKVLRGSTYRCRTCGEHIYKKGTKKPAPRTYNFG